MASKESDSTRKKKSIAASKPEVKAKKYSTCECSPTTRVGASMNLYHALAPSGKSLIIQQTASPV
jgi:hypothetical protein